MSVSRTITEYYQLEIIFTKEEFKNEELVNAKCLTKFAALAASDIEVDSEYSMLSQHIAYEDEKFIRIRFYENEKEWIKNRQKIAWDKIINVEILWFREFYKKYKWKIPVPHQLGYAYE